MRELSPDVLQTLARFDTPTVCNVIELCNYRPRNAGYLGHQIRAVYPELPPMVGYAVTATFRGSMAAGPDEKPLGLLDLVAAWENIPKPHVVVIQDLDEHSDGAVYGEVMATVFKGFGAVGLVTNGFARDVHQVGTLKFPCFAAGISPSHAYCRLLSAGDPVPIAGVSIRPGDLLHGDVNGVTTIPLPVAAQVASGCGPLVEAENIAINGAKGEPLTIEGYREVLARFLEQHDAISRRLSGRDTDRKVGV